MGRKPHVGVLFSACDKIEQIGTSGRRAIWPYRLSIQREMTMSNILMTVPAHFDGMHIRLDAEIELKPDTPLLVTILSEDLSHLALVRDAMKQSEAAFARVWENEEDAVYDQL